MDEKGAVGEMVGQLRIAHPRAFKIWKYSTKFVWFRSAIGANSGTTASTHRS
jgi:hypothetical protein